MGCSVLKHACHCGQRSHNPGTRKLELKHWWLILSKAVAQRSKAEALRLRRYSQWSGRIVPGCHQRCRISSRRRYRLLQGVVQSGASFFCFFFLRFASPSAWSASPDSILDVFVFLFFSTFSSASIAVETAVSMTFWAFLAFSFFGFWLARSSAGTLTWSVVFADSLCRIWEESLSRFRQVRSSYRMEPPVRNRNVQPRRVCERLLV